MKICHIECGPITFAARFPCGCPQLADRRDHLGVYRDVAVHMLECAGGYESAQLLQWEWMFVRKFASRIWATWPLTVRALPLEAW
jgi:hypothetical protein